MQKTELEKQKSGELFWNGDPEIGAAKSHARTLCDAYNRTVEVESQKRLALLKEIFGDCEDDIFIKPPFHCDYGYNLHVGKKFFANFDVVMLDVAEIRIGDNCLIGPQVGFYTAIHPLDPAQRAADYITGEPITVGNNVWFGGHSTILPGVTIGNNAVIGAGSVVTKDVPDNAIVAGNPAKILRYIEP